MKTEQKLEVYRELFGSLPEAPEGKELVGVEYRHPRMGEVFKNFTWDWIESRVFGTSPHPVAIFQDTHRADGTPLSIDPLPEVAGYRVEYFGQHLFPEYMGEATGYCIYACGKWHTHLTKEDKKPGGSVQHYARIFKIAQPTTLADLVGKHGQNNVWLHTLKGAVSSLIDYRDGKIHYIDGKKLECLVKYNYRWSNDPFTSYEEANEFIPE